MKIQNLLFICTSNLTRSPTCEDIFKNSLEYKTKSAGTAEHAVVKVSQDLIDWADIIFVMCERTDKHLTYIKNNFNVKDKKIIDLDLEDFIYDKRDDPVLIEDLTKRLKPYLNI